MAVWDILGRKAKTSAPVPRRGWFARTFVEPVERLLGGLARLVVIVVAGFARLIAVAAFLSHATHVICTGFSRGGTPCCTRASPADSAGEDRGPTDATRFHLGRCTHPQRKTCQRILAEAAELKPR